MASIINFFTFFIFLIFFNSRVFSHCIDYFDAIDHNVKRDIPCPLVTDDDSSRHSRRDTTSYENEKIIQIVEFKCNNATEETCNKVKNTFYAAGEIISKTFILKNPILVSINYTNICQVQPQLCNIQGKRVVIGAARSAREILLLDDDGLTRYYPQYLVKQFQYDKHPEFAPFDIIATFNSIVNWHFPSDNDLPIQSKQFDMLYIVLHELMHGIGFTSNWQNWFKTNNNDQLLITTLPKAVKNNNTGSTTFNGFKESALDRHLIFNSNYENLSSITIKLNDFAKPGTNFKNVSDLVLNFINSKQVSIAKDMNNISTTPNTISSFPKSCYSESAILETSITPFVNGQSISHFVQSYINSTDFLMTTVQVPGKTLNDLVKQSGGTNPIGPKLQAIMECLGYQTDRNPTPYRPKLVSQL